MNSRNRKKNYPALALLYGEYCNICSERGDFYTLVIDHIDDDNSNNKFDNFELLCRKCNSIKDPGGKKYKAKVLSPARVSEYVLPVGKTAEMEKNIVSEPFFRRWLFRQLRHEEKMEYSSMIDSGAERSHSSLDAVKRYAKKVCSETGWAETVKDENGTIYVQLRKPWQKKNDTQSIEEMSTSENNSRKKNDVQVDSR